LVGNGLWVCPFTRLALSLARQKVIKADGFEDTSRLSIYPKLLLFFLSMIMYEPLASPVSL
jgi:hypothetical protein